MICTWEAQMILNFYKITLDCCVAWGNTMGAGKMLPAQWEI